LPSFDRIPNPQDTEPDRPDLAGILAELSRSPQPDNLHRHVELCRRALSLLEGRSSQELQAPLHALLATFLAQDPEGDQDSNMERAIEAFGLALEVIGKEDTPVPWAAIMNDLGNTYTNRLSGDHAENVEHAIELYRHAFQVRTRDLMPMEWSDTLTNLGIAYMERIRGDQAENMEYALRAFEQALEVRAPDTTPIEWVRTMMYLGKAHLGRIRGKRAQNQERAIAIFNQVLPVAAKEPARVMWAKTLMNLAVAYAERIGADRDANIDRSIDLHEQSLAVLTRESMPMEWVRTMIELGRLHRQRIRGSRADNLKQAIKYWTLAAEVAKEDTMPQEWRQLQTHLARTYQEVEVGSGIVRSLDSLGRTPRGADMDLLITACLRGLELKSASVTPEERAVTLSLLGFAYLEQMRGDQAENIERAISFLEQALDLQSYKSVPDAWLATMSTLVQAYGRRIRGDRTENVERAIEISGRILAVTSRESMPQAWLIAMQNLSSAYQERIKGEYSENIEHAIALCEEILEVATHETMPEHWALTMVNLGNLYRDRTRGDKADNLERAIGFYEQVLEVLSLDVVPFDWALAKRNLANAYAHRIYGDRTKNLEQALQAYEDALKVTTPESMPIEWAKTMHDSATTYRARICGNRVENRDRAINGYQRVLEVMTMQAMPDGHRMTQRALAAMLFEEGRWEEAATAFHGALSASELLYWAAATPEARQAELAEVDDIPPRLAYSLAKTGSVVEAAVAMERGRARSMAEILALDEASLDGVQPEDKEQFEQIRERIRELQSEARLSKRNAAPRNFIALSTQLREAYDRLEKKIGCIRAYRPGFLPETSFEVLRDAAAQSPLVYLLATRVGGLILVLEGSGQVGVTWAPQLTTEALDGRLTHYFERYRRQHLDREAWLKELDSLLRWLWDAVMGPMVAALSSQCEAVLIPAGVLGLLPLHAAWTEDPRTPTGRRYACDGITFRYAPSARALQSALKRAPGGVQDTIFAVDEPTPVRAMPLPSSTSEITAATSHFPPAPQSKVLAHREATRQSVLNVLAQYSVLHFSCHGSPDFAEPLNGGLVMANDEVLTLRDFLEIRLPRARLAVLSACATAIVGTKLPDEVLSLPSGLLQAGVEGVVASLWFVSDCSTMMLMTRFYEFWRKEGMSAAEALRVAQQWVRDTSNGEKAVFFKQSLPEFSSRGDVGSADALYKTVSLKDPDARDFAHPSFWAAFTYTGV
jgi:CHAT domain-containing protein